MASRGNLDGHLVVAAYETVGQGANPGHLVEGGREGVLLEALEMREELVGQDVGAVAAPLHRHCGFAQAVVEVLGLLHDPLHLFLQAHLLEAAGEDLHGPSRHAAVGVEALVDHHFVHEVLMVFGVVRGQKAAGGALGVLGAVDLEDVGGLGDLLDQGSDAASRHPLFVSLDVPGVLDDPGAVEHQALAVTVGQRPDGAEVLQAEGVLSVAEGLQAHDGDLASLQDLLEPFEVHVAGEDLGLVVPDIGDLHVARGQDVDAGTGIGG